MFLTFKKNIVLHLSCRLQMLCIYSTVLAIFYKVCDPPRSYFTADNFIARVLTRNRRGLSMRTDKFWAASQQGTIAAIFVGSQRNHDDTRWIFFTIVFKVNKLYFILLKIGDVTFYCTIPALEDPEKEAFGKHCAKRRKCW